MSDTTTVNETGTQPSSQAAGYLLDKFGIYAALGGLLLAAWFHQLVIVILLSLVLSAAGLARLWSRFSLVGVHCQRQLSEQRAFPGESIELTLRAANRKLLPLPWLKVDDEIPDGFAPGVSLTPSRPGFGFLTRTVALLWYSRASWRHQLYCARRGYFPLGPITVTSGDIFGFYPRSKTEPLIDHVIVYPKIYPITHLGIPSLFPLGETRAERRIFEDPTRTIGIRDYSPHDALKRIHWKASARRQNLQVKVYEPTTTLKAAVFLAIDSYPRDKTTAGEFELGISTAASVANYLTERKSAVGLFVNSRLVDSSQPARIPPASGAGQLVGILESLAKVTRSASGPFEDFLDSERRGLPWGTTLVFILSHPSPSLVRLLTSLAENGHKLVVLRTGDDEIGPFGPAIACHRIRNPGDLTQVKRA